MGHHAGRNKPCSCNSGKKYKKCCLNNQPITTTELHHKLHDMDGPHVMTGMSTPSVKRNNRAKAMVSAILATIISS